MNENSITSSKLVQNIKLKLYLLKKSPLSIVGIFLILITFSLATFAPFIAPYPNDVKDVHMRLIYKPPSKNNLMGTDFMGRDILSRCVFGLRVSILLGIAVVALSAGIGISLGLIAGYIGGRTRTIIMRITDIFFTIPGIALALIVASILGPSLTNAMIALSFTWWPSYTRLTQGLVLSIKQEMYIEASKSLGSNPLRIIYKDILPNCLAVLVVKCTMDMGWAVLSGAGLSFLGMGVQPPYPELGSMISEGRELLPTVWWPTFFPGIFILISVLGLNLFGDGLRDMLEIEL